MADDVGVGLDGFQADPAELSVTKKAVLYVASLKSAQQREAAALELAQDLHAAQSSRFEAQYRSLTRHASEENSQLRHRLHKVRVFTRLGFLAVGFIGAIAAAIVLHSTNVTAVPIATAVAAPFLAGILSMIIPKD